MWMQFDVPVRDTTLGTHIVGQADIVKRLKVSREAGCILHFFEYIPGIYVSIARVVQTSS